MNRLSAVAVQKLTAKGMHADGGGLYLRVTATGTKSWMFRFVRGGRMRDMGLGTFPGISLATARSLAGDCRAMLARGMDPIAERKTKMLAAHSAPTAVTFDEAVKRYLAAHESGWKNPKHRTQWDNSLTTYASPVFGKRDVAAITTDDILKVLEPIWKAKPETASRVRGRVENILDWAKVRGLRDGANPAMWRGHLAHLLPARNKTRTVKHFPAMPWRDVPAFMTELRGNNSLSARALEFIILTCVRTSEAIEAQWSEIDLEARIWVIPKERMKTIREHRVPLSDAAVALLEVLPRVQGNPYLFPGARPRRPLSNMAALELLRGMRPGFTTHGFRSSFRDWAAEATSFPREIAEAALAHITSSSVERAYQRGDLFEKRAKLMKAWAEFCGRPVSNLGRIVPIRGKA
jgi:integrase